MTLYQPALQTAGESALQLRKTTVSSEPQIPYNMYGIRPLPVYTLSIIIAAEALSTGAAQHLLCNTQLDPLGALCLKAAAAAVCQTCATKSVHCCLFVLGIQYDTHQKMSVDGVNESSMD